MPERDYDDEARRLITGRCLIATDVDKTILRQTDDRNQEKEEFFRQIAPQLGEAARLGANIAFLTGNSMHEMCSRVLKWLVEQLSLTNDLMLIGRFHFFCSSGGVYLHFDPNHEDLRSIFESGLNGRKLQKKFLKAICEVQDDGQHSVRPQFIDPSYVERCMIEPEEIDTINSILSRIADHYMVDLEQNLVPYEQLYDLGWIRDDTGKLKKPAAELRTTAYGPPPATRAGTVQITLKPVLSFRQARKGREERLFGNDVRTRMITLIQEELDRAGLGHYVARGGGRGSIDITLEKLDKAYGLEFLIDRLELQGNIRAGQAFGSNTIYFGDEVIVGGGNDYPVVRIPGLLVLAVNLETKLVPFLHGVFVPSTDFQGPKATASILTQFNSCASQMLIQHRKRIQDGSLFDGTACVPVRTAIEQFKIELFCERIKKKLSRMELSTGTRVEDWQTLHTFTTLLGRNDTTARQCLGILIKTLDGMMEQLAETSNMAQPAIGMSHHD